MNSDPNSVIVITLNLFWWNLFGQRNGADFFNVFKSYGPFDIMLFQECDDVGRIIKDSGFGCFTPYTGSRAVTLAWNANRFEELAKGAKDVAEDRPEQYYGFRTAVWARLREKSSGKTFFILSHHGPLPVNTGGADGGAGTAGNIKAVIDANKDPKDTLVLAGDFNADANFQTITTLKNSYQLIASDWVDHLFTLPAFNNDGSYYSAISADTEIVYNTGSDHRGIRAIYRRTP